jgi:hypothetical protein
MKIQHLIPILFLAAFCTVSAQTNNAPTNTNTRLLQAPGQDKSLATDSVRALPSPIELILNCGNVYSHKFIYQFVEKRFFFETFQRE